MAAPFRKTGVTDDQIVRAYRRLRSAYAVGRALGVSDRTVYVALVRRGEPRVGRARYTPAQVRAIVAAYRRGERIHRIAARVGGGATKVRKALLRAGVPMAAACGYGLRATPGRCRECGSIKWRR